MKSLSKRASKVLDALTRGLHNPGDARRVDNTDSVYMYVAVECIGDCRFSVAHYYVQNGDMMRDPEMTFFLADDGNYYPMTFQMDALGIYRVGVEFGEGGHILRANMREQADQARFANQWMSNIADQQGGLRAIRAA